MSVRRAFLLAAGLGTRLRPLTERLPKPAWPFFDLPIAAHALAALREAGVEEAVVNLHHLGGLLRDILAPHAPAGMTLSWSPEDPILGTGGALVPWAEWLAEGPFYLVNADTYRELDLTAMEAFHREGGGVATLLLAPLPEGAKGPAEVDERGKIVRLLDSRAPGYAPGRPCEFAGIHILEPEVLAAAVSVGKTAFCIVADVHAKLVSRGAPVFGCLLPASSWWSDLGTPERYLDAHAKLLSEGRLPAGTLGKFVGGETLAPGGGRIVGPSFLGPGSRVERGATAGPFAVLGAGSRVEAGVQLRECVVWPGTTVGKSLRRAIAGGSQVLGA